MKKTSRVVLAGAALAGALTVGALLWLRYAPRRVPQGQPPLATLSPGSLPAFRDVFNASEGQVRVLVLLSPT